MNAMHAARCLPLPWRSLLVAGLAVAAFLALGSAPGALVYDRDALAHGEFWRLLSAHLAHAGGSHLLWDVAGLLALGVLFEARLGRLFFPVLFAGAAAIDVWLWLGSGLARYCGLSGVLNSLLAAGLVVLWRESRSWAAPITGVLALSKIAVEATRQTALFTDTAWPPVPPAHAVGFLAGLAAWALVWRLAKSASTLAFEGQSS